MQLQQLLHPGTEKDILVVIVARHGRQLEPAHPTETH